MFTLASDKIVAFTLVMFSEPCKRITCESLKSENLFKQDCILKIRIRVPIATYLENAYIQRTVPRLYDSN